MTFWDEYHDVCRYFRNGNIKGRVVHKYWCNVFDAYANGEYLGEFVSSDSAMSAVERCIC